MRRFNRHHSLPVLALLGLAAASVIILRSPVRLQEGRVAGPSSVSYDERGRLADTPEAIPTRGLRDVFWRVIHEVSGDRVLLIAAGVTFYLLLAMFPALAALVSLYGLVADPLTIADHLQQLAVVLPPGAFDIVAEQVRALAERRESALGATFFVGLAIALWSTHSGTLSLFDAMNVAYEEEEKRSLVRLNLIGLAFTLCAVFFATAIVALIAVLPVVLSYVWMDQFEEKAMLWLRWPLLLIVVSCAVTALYRFGPSREPARLRWLTWGALLTTVGWIAMSFGFSFYLGHFANYNVTYGTLGALIGFLIWTWLSVAILIVGAEINAELEHQTTRDTTTGQPVAMGMRGAYVADTIGRAVD